MGKIKLLGIISLVFVLSIAYQVLASYLTSPSGLKYPNPGHYPEQIGPGTFNCSGNANCYWEFPNAMYISSSSGKIGIGTKTPTEKLEVVGNIKASKMIDRDNTNYYIDPSSTSKVVRIEASDHVKAPKIVDKDNTDYYVDPASTSKMNVVEANKIKPNTLCLKRNPDNPKFVCIDNWEDILDLLFAEGEEK